MTTIYHNPRCSKSRASLELLEKQNPDFEIIKYLETPPSEAELKALVAMLGITPKELVRTGETIFKELGLDKKDLSEDEWISIMAENPKLIERPIVVHNGKAAIGRPIEKVIEILEGK